MRQPEPQQRQRQGRARRGSQVQAKLCSRGLARGSAAHLLQGCQEGGGGVRHHLVDGQPRAQVLHKALQESHKVLCRKRPGRQAGRRGGRWGRWAGSQCLSAVHTACKACSTHTQPWHPPPPHPPHPPAHFSTHPTRPPTQAHPPTAPAHSSPPSAHLQPTSSPPTCSADVAWHRLSHDVLRQRRIGQPLLRVWVSPLPHGLLQHPLGL